MNRTTEHLLTWGTLGAGVALVLSNHRRWGLAVSMVAPVTVATQHPRATMKALKAVPKSLAKAGTATGKAVGKAGYSVGKSVAEAGKGLKWVVS